MVLGALESLAMLQSTASSVAGKINFSVDFIHNLPTGSWVALLRWIWLQSWNSLMCKFGAKSCVARLLVEDLYLFVVWGCDASELFTFIQNWKHRCRGLALSPVSVHRKWCNNVTICTWAFHGLFCRNVVTLLLSLYIIIIISYRILLSSCKYCRR